MNQEAKKYLTYDCHKQKTPLLTKEQARGCRKVVSKKEKLKHPNKTYALTPDPRQWFLFDAKGKTLGRLASEVAKFLRGKHHAEFTPHVDCGDGVVIINAEKVEVTGMKLARKVYRKYTGFVGGLRETPYSTMLDRNPEFILSRAIQGMMPKSRLGHQQLKKLRVYKGSEIPMSAQKPTLVNI